MLKLLRTGNFIVSYRRNLAQILPNIAVNNCEKKKFIPKQIRLLCTSSNICWNCKKNTSYIDLMFCEHCKYLRPTNENNDHFEILGLEKKYEIDINDLSQKYKSLQKLLHPDKFTNRSQVEQDLSLEWSSKVNKAYATLSNPLERAEYLLKSLGLSLSEESETKDTEFLMEMMERNEEISEISTSKQAMESLKNIQAIIRDLGVKLGEHVHKKDYENAIKVLARMKYFYSLENNLKTKAAALTGTIE